MRDYFSDRLFNIGLAVLVFGSGPLILIILLASIGLWPDPNPNPIGPGILAGVSFWPGVILTGIAVWRVRVRRADALRAAQRR